MVMIADLDQELLTNDNHNEEISKKTSILDEIENEKSLLASPIKNENMGCDDSAVCDPIDEIGEELLKSPTLNEEPITEKVPFEKLNSLTDPACKDSDKPIDKDILSNPEKDNTNVLSPVEIVGSNNIDIKDDAASINRIIDEIEIENSQETPAVVNSPNVNTVTTNVSFEISDDESDVIKKKVIEFDDVEGVNEKDDKVEVVTENDDKVEPKEKADEDDKVERKEKVDEDDKVEVVKEKIIEDDKAEVKEKAIDSEKVEGVREKVIEGDAVKEVKDTDEKANEHDKSEETMCIDDDDDDDIVLIDDSTKRDKTEITSSIKNINENDCTSKTPEKIEEDKGIFIKHIFLL